MPAFLFDPTASVAALADYPDLAAATDPRREGFEADWLEGMRKSERQLYRVLGNTHYEHLTELLIALDYCLGCGFNQPTLLRSRGRSPFAAALAELRVAEHFARLGASVDGYDDIKGGDRVPDLLVGRDGYTLAVEVYCPLVWDNLETFCDELTSTVKNIDLPWDFRFELGFEQLNVFDERHRLLHLHPAELNDALADGRSAALVGAVAEALAACLDDPPASVAVEEIVDDMNLKIKLALDDVALTQERLPARFGVISGPNVSAYRPEAVFARIVELAAAKARVGQALAVDADAAVLVVDLGSAGVFSELRNETYRRLFLDRLAIDPDAARAGHAAVVFVESPGWGQPLIPWFLNSDGESPKPLIDLLDPRGAIAASAGVDT